MSYSTKTDGRPSYQFYPDDWTGDPALRLSSLAARGLWKEMNCLMFRSPQRGYLIKPNGSKYEAKDLAKVVGASLQEVDDCLAELGENEVFSTTSDGVIHCRRMVRDEAVRQARSEAGRKGGLFKQTASKTEANAKQNPRSSSSSSSPTPTPSPEISEENHVSSAAPTATAESVAESNKKKMQEWGRWKDSWVQTMREGDGLPESTYRHYLDELERCLDGYYDGRGGRMTPTRYQRLARSLARAEPDACFLAIEMFCDKHGVTKDERYLAGIARRLSPLSDAEFKADMDRHRAAFNGRGLWSGRPDEDAREFRPSQLKRAG